MVVMSVARCLVAAGVALLSAGGSQAAAAVLSSTTDGSYPLKYSYTADAGESNALTAHTSEGMLVLSDAGAAITVAPTAPCTQQSPSQVTCAEPQVDQDTGFGGSLGDEDDTADVNLPGWFGLGGGAGNDRITVSGYRTFVGGDEGDDRLIGGPGADQLDGGDGADHLSSGGGGVDTDQLWGGSGPDRLIGSSDDDVFDGGPDADVVRGRGGSDSLNGGKGRDDLSGGTDRDTVVYARGSGRVSVTLDGRANDGSAGERDWVHRDIEDASIIRGRAVGNSEVNHLGADSGTLIGGGGADWLLVWKASRMYGGTGADHLTGKGKMFGGPGSDRLSTYSGGGRLDGGSGDDELVKRSRPAAAHLIGGAGDDTIDARDGRCREGRPCARDRIDCGRGHDRVTADRRDIVASDCERLTHRSATPGRVRLSSAARRQSRPPLRGSLRSGLTAWP
jgi:Ca2+-binding RTX toxin-like protein